jgi:hypothetical protein
MSDSTIRNRLLETCLPPALAASSVREMLTLFKDQALDLYEAARQESSTIYDREKLAHVGVGRSGLGYSGGGRRRPRAAYWLERLDFFGRHLAQNMALSDSIQSLIEIEQACKSSYELHA